MTVTDARLESVNYIYSHVCLFHSPECESGTASALSLIPFSIVDTAQRPEPLVSTIGIFLA